MANGNELEKISSVLESMHEAELRIVIIELRTGDEIDKVEKILREGHIAVIKIVTADQSIVRRTIERAKGAIRNTGGEIFAIGDTPYILITPGSYVRVVKE